MGREAITKLLDRTNQKLLAALQSNARVSLSELGRQVGLTAPAVAERVRRLEEAELITGYRATVNPALLGWTIMAFIRIQAPAEKYPRLIALLKDLPEIEEGHHLTGSESFLIKARVASTQQLEALIGRLSPFGQTATSVVLSSPVEKKTWSLTGQNE